MARLDIEAEVTLHRLHQSLDATLGIHRLGHLLFVGHILRDILVSDLKDLFLLPALGNNEVHTIEFDIGSERHDHLFEFTSETALDLSYGIREYLGGSLGEPTAELHIEALDHCAVV